MDARVLAPARRPGWMLDALAVVAATGVLVAVSAHAHTTTGRPLDGLGYGLLVAAGMAAGLGRRGPKTATAVTTVVLAVFVVRQYPDGPVWVTGLIALATLGWRCGRRAAAVGAVGMLAVLAAVALLAGGVGWLIPAIYAGWALAAVLGGAALRNRRSYLASLQERALSAERTREEEAGRRVAEERLRIARDLHDSVAHGMATISVQAGAAAHVISRRPEAAAEALAVIQRASGDVLDELAAMLAVLRDDTQQADRAPVPGAGEIARLAETTTEAGLTVALTVEGPAREVPGVIGTAAYRVVQESLTNVLRHSTASIARVRLVEVGDDGPGAAGTCGGTGVGIRGMRERVTSTGGRFQAGPAAGGGFLVRAEWEGRA